MTKKHSLSTSENKIGVIYARYSSHNQKDTSIEQQIAAGQQKASSLGISVIDTYEDRAVTGKTDKRPSFQKMMRDAELGKFKYVIAWKSNRIGRNMLEAMMNEATLNALGVCVSYVEEDFDDSAAGRFALRSMMNVNQFYSESMAEDIKRGMDDNAEKCMVNGSVGYGHKKGPDGRFAVDEEKANVLLEIYTRVSDREPFVDISADLNSRGIPSPSGGKWNRSSFHRLLPPNDRVRGFYIWGNHRVEGGVPRLISDELYFKVSEVLKMKKNAQGRHRSLGDYLLTGKLYCGYCNKPMTGYSGTGKSGKLHQYYVCQTRRLEHTCKKKNVRRDEIEAAVVEAIHKYALCPETLEWIADSAVAYMKKLEEGASIAILQDRLNGVNRSICNIMTAIEQGIITDTTKDRLIALETEKAELSNKIALEKESIISIPREDVIAGLAMFRDGDINDPKYLASLFDTFLVAVYLFDDEIKIVFSFSGKNKTKTVPFDSSTLARRISSCVKSCSFKLSKAPPRESQTNPPQIFMFDGIFVLALSYKN